MTNEELNTLLKEQATKLGACSKGMLGWENILDHNELISKYVKNVEFAIDNDFPSIEFIKDNFTRVELAIHGVYVDDKLNADSKTGTIILNGKCFGRLSFKRFDVATIYVRHDTDIQINASDLSKVFISVYDNAKVRINQYDVAKVYVYKKSPNVEVITSGDVRLREYKG